MTLSEFEERTNQLSVEKDKRVSDRPRFLVYVVGFFLLSISLITSGVAYIEIAIHGNNVTWDDGYMLATSCYLDFIAMPLLLIIAGYGFKHNVYNMSVFLMTYGIFNLVYAVSCRMQELTTVSAAYLCIILGILILVPGLISLQKKVYMFAFATILMSFGLIVGELIHPGNAIYGVTIMISGWVFAYLGIARLIYSKWAPQYHISEKLFPASAGFFTHLIGSLFRYF